MPQAGRARKALARPVRRALAIAPKAIGLLDLRARLSQEGCGRAAAFRAAVIARTPMTFDPIESLGLVAGLFGAFAPTLQAIKIIRTRSAADVSLAMFVVALVGSILWFGYGLLKAAPSIVFWNGVAIIMFIAIVWLKFRFTTK
jgi:MtN3 and saliva related transmembrane protein